MLKRIKATARQLREFALNLIGQGADTTTVDPLLIKTRIPRTWWCKRRTKGRVVEAKRVFATFTEDQQEYAIARGWFPKDWAPYLGFGRGADKSAYTKRKVIHEGNAVARGKL